MAEQLASPIAVAFTWMLLHFLWQGSAIAIAYWLLFEQRRYAISLSMLGAMAVCPIATFVWLYDPNATTLHPESAYILNDNVNTNTSSGRQEDSERTVSSKGTKDDTNDASSQEFTSDSQSDIVTATLAATSKELDSIQKILHNIQPYLLLVWGLGVLVSGLRLSVGFLNILWLRSGIEPIPDGLRQRSVLLARKLGLSVSRVFASSRIREAAVVGFWRPVVLLPTAWLAALPPDVLEAVIAHELAHIRRFDVWVNLLQRLLESFFFYHPAVWWLSNRVRLDREMCCDELAVQVIGNRGQYAIALEHVGRMQVFGAPSLATTFRGDRKMFLYRRIQNILGTTNAPAREPAFLVGIVLVAMTLVLIGFIGTGVQTNIATAQDREPRSPERDKVSNDRTMSTPEDEATINDREKKLLETVEKLQRELNDLRVEVREEYLPGPKKRFQLFDRNRDYKITPQEWFERYVSEDSYTRMRITNLEGLKLQRDVLSKNLGEFHKDVQDKIVQIALFEDDVKHVLNSFVAQWSQADSNGDDIVNQDEFLRWSPGTNRPLTSNFVVNPLKERVSQQIRRERLDPLIEKRKMLLTKYGESPLLVSDLTWQIKNLEDKIATLEKKEAQIFEETMRSLNGSPALRPRNGGETPRVGPRDGEGLRKGPRDGDAPKLGPRDGEASRVITPRKESQK